MGVHYKAAVLVPFLLFMASSCARLPLAPNNPEYVLNTSYKLLDPVVVNTGAVMIGVQQGTGYPSYRLIKPMVFARGRRKVISQSEIWIAKYKYKGDGADYVVVMEPKDERQRIQKMFPGWGVIMKKDGSVVDSPILPFGKGKRFLEDEPVTQDMPEKVDGVIFEYSGLYPVEKDYMKYELLYNGIEGGRITIQYREFVENIARPSFYQEVHYDLNDSKRFNFKDLKIEVLEADNMKIKFIVVSDGYTDKTHVWQPAMNITSSPLD